MSRARIQKLEALLARVERRRAEPRLVPVGVQDVASANTNVSGPSLNVASARAAAPSPAERAHTIPSPRPKGPVSFEAASAGFRAQGEEPRAPTAHLSLDHPARRASSLPPPPVATADTLPRQPATPPPPASGSEPPVRAPTEVLPTAAPERIAPQPTASAESAVQVVSAPRIDAPRSFGELLALSLSLRPR